MKIIFLDFDGVLRSLESIKHGDMANDKVSGSALAALNHIIEKTKAGIVVSSSWRGRYVAPLRRLLGRWGVKGKVVGVTPRLEHQTGAMIVTAETRGTEIQHWLFRNPVTSFVVLDDEDNGFDRLRDRLVKTDFGVGLTMEDAMRAIDILNMAAP